MTEYSRKKRNWFLMLLILILLLALSANQSMVFVNQFLLQNPPKSLNEETLAVYFSRIGRTYRPTKEFFCDIVSKSTPNLREYLGTVDKHFSETMSDLQRYVLLESGNVASGDHTPQEVYGVIECHLFLLDVEIAFDIVAISWRYTSGGVNNSRFQRTTITPEQFLELYDRCDVEGLSRRKAARVLGDKWMEETGYVKLK